MQLETAAVAFGSPSQQRARAFPATSVPFNLECLRATARPVGQELTTRLTDRVGFKLIGELINEDQIILGREESKGLSIKGHYPKKDGFFASRLQAKAGASRKSIDAPLDDRIEDPD